MQAGSTEQVQGFATDDAATMAPIGIAVHRARAAASAWGAVAATETASEVTTATVVAALAADPDVPVSVIADLLTDAATLSGADPLRVGMLALAAPEIVSAPIAHALGAHVALLAAVAGVRGAAVWRLEGEHDLALAAWTGEDDLDDAGTRAAADAVLCGDPVGQDAVVVSAFGSPCAALAWVPGDEAPAVARMFATRSACQLGLAFERAALLDGTIAQHAALGRSAERRLSRVAFDLHDGPMQDLALLCAELQRVRGALDAASAVGSHDDATAATARRSPDPRALIDDVLAIAEATSTDLRELATSMESSTLLQRPFDDALHGIARAFALRSSIEPELWIEGDAAGLTDMERVTLLRVIGEALTNAREHSGATRVAITVKVTSGRVEASVVDDGAGFDVEATLPAAARRGSLGLLGMIERVRLMDGRCEVLSTPGAGTTVALSILRLASAVRMAGERGADAVQAA